MKQIFIIHYINDKADKCFDLFAGKHAMNPR